MANDMHLGLNVPNTWYRTRLVYNDSEVGSQDVTGVTLPGAPVMVSGSNRYVAWANTASDVDISNLVTLEFDHANPRRYRTPGGWRELESFTEVIPVRGGTNALYLAPPDVIGLHFGDSSLAKFEADASEHGASFALHESPELALDIDEPSDLAALQERRAG